MEELRRKLTRLPLRVEIEREDDGRFLASVPNLPGVMAYGTTQDAAVCKATSIALEILRDELNERGVVS